MGVEPTFEREAARTTVLKTARPTGTRPPPWRSRSIAGVVACGGGTVERSVDKRWTCRAPRPGRGTHSGGGGERVRAGAGGGAYAGGGPLRGGPSDRSGGVPGGARPRATRRRCGGLHADRPRRDQRSRQPDRRAAGAGAVQGRSFGDVGGPADADRGFDQRGRSDPATARGADGAGARHTGSSRGASGSSCGNTRSRGRGNSGGGGARRGSGIAGGGDYTGPSRQRGFADLERPAGALLRRR